MVKCLDACRSWRLQSEQAERQRADLQAKLADAEHRAAQWAHRAGLAEAAALAPAQGRDAQYQLVGGAGAGRGGQAGLHEQQGVAAGPEEASGARQATSQWQGRPARPGSDGACAAGSAGQAVLHEGGRPADEVAARSSSAGSARQPGKQGQSAPAQQAAGDRQAAEQTAALQADRTWKQPAEDALTPQTASGHICMVPTHHRRSASAQKLAPEVGSSDASLEQGSTATPTPSPTIISFDATYDSAGRASLPSAVQLSPRTGGPPARQQQREESPTGQLAAAAVKAGDDAAASGELPLQPRTQEASPPRQGLYLMLLSDAAKLMSDAAELSLQKYLCCCQ